MFRVLKCILQSYILSDETDNLSLGKLSLLVLYFVFSSGVVNKYDDDDDDSDNTEVCERDLSGELNANRPVPFRLTPNIAEFLTIIGVTGPLTAAMLVTARCFVYPPYKISSYLSAILRDEYITWHKKVCCVLCLIHRVFIAFPISDFCQANLRSQKKPFALGNILSYFITVIC